MTHVSIVIPCFNHARFLPEAIGSALAQTWPHVDVVVVDDGSTDGAAAIAKRYAVRLVRQANQGLARARNAGLRAASGDVLIFLDADDRLRPRAAAAAAEAFAAHPRALMAFGRCELVAEDGAPLVTNLPRVTGNFYEHLLRHNYIWTPGMAAYRRQAFDAVGGFDPRWNAAADYDMYLRLASRDAVAAHDEVVAEYRQHAASMSRDPVRMLEATLAAHRAQRARARRHPDTWAAYRAGRRHWRDWYGEHLVERFRTALRTPGGWREALRCAWHLLRLHPRGVARHVLRKIKLSVQLPTSQLRNSQGSSAQPPTSQLPTPKPRSSQPHNSQAP